MVGMSRLSGQLFIPRKQLHGLTSKSTIYKIKFMANITLMKNYISFLNSLILSRDFSHSTQ